MQHGNSSGSGTRVRRKSSRARRKATAAATSAAASTTAPSMNRLYKAPQTTMRTAQQQNMYRQPAYGGVLLDDAGVGMKSGTRRRRRGSFNNNNTSAGARNNAHNDSSQHIDLAPTAAERQESDDGSLGTMALTIASDREKDHQQSHQYIDVDMIPPIPILWADNEMSSPRNRNLSSSSPYVSKRNGSIPPEKTGVHHRISPRTGQQPTKKKTQKNRDSNNNSGSGRALRYGHEDYSESMVDDSFVGGGDYSDHSNSHDERKSNRPKKKKSFWRFLRQVRAKSLTSYNQHFSWIHLAQVTILLILAIYVYDSHSKVQSHRNQLREYDQERSQILEQMMWIDKAAKKVHKKFSDQEPLAASDFLEDENRLENGDGGGSLRGGDEKTSNADLEALKDAEQTLEQIHHTIQLNARHHLATTFGDSPAEVSLQVSEDSSVLIGLSDDTPHAISTLVQQVSGHMWDQIKVLPQEQDVSDNTEAFMGRLQLIGKPSDPSTATSPVLEYVERSHGCREVGSVSLRQQEAAHLDGVSSGDAAAMDAAENPFVLVLIVNLDPQASSLPKGEVCIGSVLKGLDTLVKLKQKQ